MKINNIILFIILLLCIAILVLLATKKCKQDCTEMVTYGSPRQSENVVEIRGSSTFYSTTPFIITPTSDTPTSDTPIYLSLPINSKILSINLYIDFDCKNNGSGLTYTIGGTDGYKDGGMDINYGKVAYEIKVENDKVVKVVGGNLDKCVGVDLIKSPIVTTYDNTYIGWNATSTLIPKPETSWNGIRPTGTMYVKIKYIPN
jgi:hypothetical protein